MRVIIQRSLNSSVKVQNKIVGKIDKGLVLLVGFTFDDNIEDINYIINKIINMRLFNDENGVMNKSLLDVNGQILSVSQFTLYADVKKGRKPSYSQALDSNDAKRLYEIFNEKLENQGVKVKTGIFGSDMLVNIINDGPVTIMIESRK